MWGISAALVIVNSLPAAAAQISIQQQTHDGPLLHRLQMQRLCVCGWFAAQTLWAFPCRPAIAAATALLWLDLLLPLLVILLLLLCVC